MKAAKALREVTSRINKWMGGATVIAAVDGSLKGEGDDKRVSYGVWQGLGPKEGDSETTAQMRANARRAMHAGRLPGTWDIEMAEMYAIHCVLKTAWEAASAEEGGGAANERVLIMSDALSMLQAIERAWRGGKATGLDKRKCGGMLKRICWYMERWVRWHWYTCRHMRVRIRVPQRTR